MIDKTNNVTIDLDALPYNLEQIRTFLGKGTKIMGVVKSNAYGHGLVPVSKTLERSGIDYLGVSYIHEAIELRNDGISLPIVILCGVQTKDDARQAVENDLIPVLFDSTVAENLDRESQRQGKRTRIHIKVDTGMGRLGISHGEVGPFIRKINSLKSLDIEALTSHLSSADERSGTCTDDQTANFRRAIDTALSLGLHLTANNLANSAGIACHKQAHFEMVRPGIMLYGGLPSPQFESPVSLKPVMHFKGRVLQVRSLPARTPVSYGGTYVTNGPTQIAVLSAGYGDGLPRSMSNRGKVLVKGRRVRIIGRICMNLTMCDITGLNNVTPGDEVVFLGSQGDETITGDDMARWADTISYEVFCSIGHGYT
jgi:alanine racemase